MAYEFYGARHNACTCRGIRIRKLEVAFEAASFFALFYINQIVFSISVGDETQFYGLINVVYSQQPCVNWLH